MIPMHKMAAVGRRDEVLVYRALGMTVLAAEDVGDLNLAVFRLAQDGHAIIFVTETVFESSQETRERFRDEPVPAIIPIPGAGGGTGLGMARVKENVEKAIGADILFQKEGND